MVDGPLEAQELRLAQRLTGSNGMLKGKADPARVRTCFSDKNLCLEDVDEISMALKRCAAWPKSVLSFPDLVFVLSQQSYKHRHHQTMVHHLTVLDHPFLKLLS